MMGHINEAILKRTASNYNVLLTGKLRPCIHYALAKINALPISKSPDKRSVNPGEKLFIDISYHKEPSPVGSQYWLLFVDDATDFAFSLFMRMKSDTTKRMLPLLQQFNARGKLTKIIRCDNSPENNTLRKN
jgi:hypothetical protein